VLREDINNNINKLKLSPRFLIKADTDGQFFLIYESMNVLSLYDIIILKVF